METLGEIRGFLFMRVCFEMTFVSLLARNKRQLSLPVRMGAVDSLETPATDLFSYWGFFFRE